MRAYDLAEVFLQIAIVLASTSIPAISGPVLAILSGLAILGVLRKRSIGLVHF